MVHKIQIFRRAVIHNHIAAYKNETVQISAVMDKANTDKVTRLPSHLCTKLTFRSSWEWVNYSIIINKQCHKWILMQEALIRIELILISLRRATIVQKEDQMGQLPISKQCITFTIRMYRTSRRVIIGKTDKV